MGNNWFLYILWHFSSYIYRPFAFTIQIDIHILILSLTFKLRFTVSQTYFDFKFINVIKQHYNEDLSLNKQQKL